MRGWGRRPRMRNLDRRRQRGGACRRKGEEGDREAPFSLRWDRVESRPLKQLEETDANQSQLANQEEAIIIIFFNYYSRFKFFDVFSKQ